MKSRSAATRLAALWKVLAVTYRHTNRVLALTQSSKNLRSDSQIQEDIFGIAKTWLQELTSALKCEVQAHGSPLSSQPCLIVSNHVSYLDIPVLMSLTKGSFVAKTEIGQWPIFGRAAKSYGTVFVDRKDPVARKKVGETIAQYIVEKKQSVILFPEGTTSATGVEWRRGAFNIAFENKIPVQPVRVVYHPHDRVAFCGEVTFMGHLWKLLGEQEITAEVEFFEPQLIQNVERDTLEIQNRVQKSLATRLEKF